jgi:hypothetical protein
MREALLTGDGHVADMPFDLLNSWKTLIREPRTKVDDVFAAAVSPAPEAVNQSDG